MPVTPNAVAETVKVPAFFPRAIPLERTLASCGFEDFHAMLDNTATLPSLYVPVAVNFTKVPFAIVGLAGVIAIDCKPTVETVSTVDWTTEPNDASKVVFPVVKLLTRQLQPSRGRKSRHEECLMRLRTIEPTEESGCCRRQSFRWL